jgi:hypothetical protein
MYEMLYDWRPNSKNAKQYAPVHNGFDARYRIKGVDYRNIFGELLWRELGRKHYNIGDMFREGEVFYRVEQKAFAEGFLQLNIIAIK